MQTSWQVIIKMLRVNYSRVLRLTACCFKLSLNFAGGSNQLKGFFGQLSAGFQNQSLTELAINKIRKSDHHLSDFDRFPVTIQPLLTMIKCSPLASERVLELFSLFLEKTQ